MRRLWGLLCLVWLVGTTFCFVAWSEENSPKPSFFEPGEELVYDIRKFGLKVGEASYVFHGLTPWRGRKVFLLVFTARALNFFDEERIYFDPQTFYPLEVQRSLNIFGRKEEITEEYRQREGRVLVTKRVEGRVTRQTLQKTPPIENIACFIYRYRRFGSFQTGEQQRMRLPTRDVTIQVTGKKVKQGRVFYILESRPSQYAIWFRDDPRKTPQRIQGALGAIKAVMILQDKKS